MTHDLARFAGSGAGYLLRALGRGATRLVPAWALVALAAALMGCGPIQSTSRISDAEMAVERARVSDATAKAPFEYFTAVHFLKKAKEEWGYSQFEIAYEYANNARKMAEAAVEKSTEDPWAGHPVKEVADKLTAEAEASGQKAP